jgi:hypothetical protein
MLSTAPYARMKKRTTGPAGRGTITNRQGSVDTEKGLRTRNGASRRSVPAHARDAPDGCNRTLKQGAAPLRGGPRCFEGSIRCGCRYMSSRHTLDVSPSQLPDRPRRRAMLRGPLDGPLWTPGVSLRAPVRRRSPTGTPSIDLPAAIETVRSAEIHFVPPWEHRSQRKP